MGKRRNANQIARLLREADRDLAKGLTVDDVCRKHGIATNTYWGHDYSRHLGDVVDYPMYADGCTQPFHFGPGEIENPCDSYHFWSRHPGGANFLFADGSVRFLSYSAAPIIPALATRTGGERASVPD